MKRIYLITTLILLSTQVYSQTGFEFFGVSFSEFQRVGFSENEGIQRGDQLQVSYDEFFIFGKIPAVNKPNTKLVVETSYNLKSFQYDYFNLNGANIRPDELHDIRLKLTYLQNFNEKWSLVTLIIPGYSSDFEEKISREDYLFRGGLIINYKLNRQIRVGLGGMRSYVFGEEEVLPVISLNYSGFYEKLKVELLFPNAKTTYQMTPRFKLGIKSQSDGSQYNYRDITNTNDLESDYVKFSQTNIGPTMEIQRGTILFKIDTGITVNRKVSIYTDSNDSMADISPDAGVFLKVGISYQIKGR
ncbi:MAG: DUF6268 family outer membrane beta-barrel protein [Balneola sp.]